MKDSAQTLLVSFICDSLIIERVFRCWFFDHLLPTSHYGPTLGGKKVELWKNIELHFKFSRCTVNIVRNTKSIIEVTITQIVSICRCQMRRQNLMKAGLSILLAGGCSAAQEKECLNTTQLLHIRWNPDHHSQVLVEVVDASPLLSARRGAYGFVNARPISEDCSTRSCVLIGGCSAPTVYQATIESAVIDQNSSAENLDLSWALCPAASDRSLDVSCMAAAFDQSASTVYMAGGWNGQSCLDRVIALKYQGHGNEIFTRELPRLNTDLKNATACLVKNYNDDGQLTDSKKSDSKDHLLLIGGWDGTRTLRTVFSYDLKSHCQQLFSLLPTPIECHASVLSQLHSGQCPSVFVFGGYDGVGVVDQVLRLNLADGSVETLNLKLDVAKECLSAVGGVLDGRELILVYGGWDGRSSLNDLQVFEVVHEPETTTLQLKPLTIQFVNGSQAKLEPRQRHVCLNLGDED